MPGSDLVSKLVERSLGWLVLGIVVAISFGQVYSCTSIPYIDNWAAKSTFIEITSEVT
jgi:hypothetical protein